LLVRNSREFSRQKSLNLYYQLFFSLKFQRNTAISQEN